MSTSGTYWGQIKEKGWWYWARASFVGIVGLALGSWLSEKYPAGPWEVRYKLYQFISDQTVRPPSSGDILIIKITDEEYWKGELAGRSPIKRDYLAKLVDTLCSARPKLIALDFDLSSPVVDGTLQDHPDYKMETEKLAASIIDASERCKIVLPKTLTCEADSEICIEEASVLDGYTFNPARVTRGYINLPADIRQVPLSHPRISNGCLMSFAEAIAIAGGTVNVNSLSREEKLPYVSFIWPKKFLQGGAVLSAAEALSSKPTNLKEAVEHKTVIIGGEQSRFAYDRGGMADAHSSPVGLISGVYLHANYAAAISDGRTWRIIGPTALVIEVILIAFVAFVFAVDLPSHWRWIWISVASLGLMIVALVFWQNLGIFFEPLLPVLLLFVHCVYDHLRDENHRLRKELSGRAENNHKKEASSKSLV